MERKSNEGIFMLGRLIKISDKKLEEEYNNRYQYNYIKRKIIEYKYAEALDKAMQTMFNRHP